MSKTKQSPEESVRLWAKGQPGQLHFLDVAAKIGVTPSEAYRGLCEAGYMPAAKDEWPWMKRPDTK